MPKYSDNLMQTLLHDLKWNESHVIIGIEKTTRKIGWIWDIGKFWNQEMGSPEKWPYGNRLSKKFSSEELVPGKIDSQNNNFFDKLV